MMFHVDHITHDCTYLLAVSVDLSFAEDLPHERQDCKDPSLSWDCLNQTVSK